MLSTVSISRDIKNSFFICLNYYMVNPARINRKRVGGLLVFATVLMAIRNIWYVPLFFLPFYLVLSI